MDVWYSPALTFLQRAQPGPSCGAASHLLGATRIMALKMEKAAQFEPDEAETRDRKSVV